MPCKSDHSVPFTEKRHGLDIDQLEAALCGIFTVLDQRDLERWLNLVDWAETGVKRGHIEAWWTRHKQADEERRKKEEAERKKEAARVELKKSALAKLTAAERKALGI